MDSIGPQKNPEKTKRNPHRKNSRISKNDSSRTYEKLIKDRAANDKDGKNGVEVIEEKPKSTPKVKRSPGKSDVSSLIDRAIKASSDNTLSKGKQKKGEDKKTASYNRL